MKFFMLVTLLFPTALLANCEFFYDSIKLCGELTWTSEVKPGKAATFDLKFFEKTDAKKVAIDPNKKLNIYSWMKMDNGQHHGGPGLVVHQNQNVWKVEKARFFGGMSGSWWVRVEVKDGDKVLEMKEYPVKF